MYQAFVATGKMLQQFKETRVEADPILCGVTSPGRRAAEQSGEDLDGMLQ
jgi:hypothetical protein